MKIGLLLFPVSSWIKDGISYGCRGKPAIEMAVYQVLCHLSEIIYGMSDIFITVNIQLLEKRSVDTADGRPVSRVYVPINIVVVHTGPKSIEYGSEIGGRGLGLWSWDVFTTGYQ